MAAGWFRDTSDNKLVAAADSELTPPTGHDFILKSTIEAAYTGMIWQLGTWDGTTYTPPVGIIIPATPIDPTTDAGMVQEAATNATETLDRWVLDILDNLGSLPPQAAFLAIDGIQHMKVVMARVCLNAVRTATFRVKFAEEAGSGPTDASGDAASYVDAIAADGAIEVTDKWSWVNPTTDPPARLDVDAAQAIIQVSTNLEDAPSSTDLISRKWIDDIPS